MKVTHTAKAYVHLRLNAEGEPRYTISTYGGLDHFYGKTIDVIPFTVEYDHQEALIREIATLQEEVKALEVEVPYLADENRKILLEQSQKKAQALQILLDSLPVEHKPQACASAQKPCPIHSSEGDYPL
jgi:hypothetical protein